MIVAIEGIDASGKATQAQMLVARLQRAGIPAKCFDFPYYESKVGQLIKAVLAGVLPGSEQKLTLQCLMTVNRYEYLPLLRAWGDKAAGEERGVLVLDRYWLSGVAYGRADGLDLGFLRTIHGGLPAPRRTFVLRVPVDETLRRRPERRDAYEANLDRLVAAKKVYDEADELVPELKVQHINGVGTAEVVHDRLWTATRPLVGLD